MKRAQWNGIFQLHLIFSKLNAMQAFVRPASWRANRQKD